MEDEVNYEVDNSDDDSASTSSSSSDDESEDPNEGNAATDFENAGEYETFERSNYYGNDEETNYPSATASVTTTSPSIVTIRHSQSGETVTVCGSSFNFFCRENLMEAAIKQLHLIPNTFDIWITNNEGFQTILYPEVHNNHDKLNSDHLPLLLKDCDILTIWGIADAVIGPIVPLSDLAPDWYENEPLKGQQYPSGRRVIGDGNCYYTSLAFGICEAIVESGELEWFDKVKESVLIYVEYHSGNSEYTNEIITVFQFFDQAKSEYE
jgi:hypothetical protein